MSDREATERRASARVRDWAERRLAAFPPARESPFLSETAPGKHEIEPKESGTPVCAGARGGLPLREPRRLSHPGWPAGWGQGGPCWGSGWRGRSIPGTHCGPICSAERGRGGAPPCPHHPGSPSGVSASTQLLRPGGSGLRRKRGCGAPSRMFPFVRARGAGGGCAGVTRSLASRTGLLLGARLGYPSPGSLPRLAAPSGWVRGYLAGVWSGRHPGGPEAGFLRESPSRPPRPAHLSKQRIPGRACL